MIMLRVFKYTDSENLLTAPSFTKIGHYQCCTLCCVVLFITVVLCDHVDSFAYYHVYILHVLQSHLLQEAMHISDYAL